MKLKNNDENSERNIIPSRIREARIARGYTLAELSDSIGVSSQAISQYELGSSTPKLEVMMKISQALNFPIGFFKKSRILRDTFSDSAVFFRSMKSSSQKIKEACECRVLWINDIYRYLSDFIDFPNVDLPDFGKKLSSEDLDFETIEDIAIELREYWNLGEKPIYNLVDLLQEKGFLICRIEFGNKKIDAFSQWYDGTPYIILGSDKESAVRSRFDLAHELGHLILHSKYSPKELRSKEVQDKIEEEAHYFAAAFLLPLYSFRKEPMSTSVESFVMLKSKWKVSIAAMIIRARNLHLFSDNQVRYMFGQLQKKRWRKAEPLDDQIPFEKPYIFKQAIELLLDNKIVSSDAILNEITLNKNEIDSLCFLPPELLSRKSKITTLKRTD